MEGAMRRQASRFLAPYLFGHRVWFPSFGATIQGPMQPGRQSLAAVRCGCAQGVLVVRACVQGALSVIEHVLRYTDTLALWNRVMISLLYAKHPGHLHGCKQVSTHSKN
jgi:hypothetical protein